MEGAEKEALSMAHDKIVQDLQPYYIIQDLVDGGVVRSEEKEKILAEDTEESQTKLLLKVIESGGEDAYNCFIKSLRSEGKYDWLADLLDENQKYMQNKLNNYKQILTRGGVPHLPPHMLFRKTLQEEIISMLGKIYKNSDSGWVVIHGMAGSGKSLLAAAVVRESMSVCDMFPHGIFWVKIGHPVSEDGLLTKMHMLCEKLDPSFRGNVPCSLEMASDRLRVLFTSGDYTQTLLIVDDVWDDWVIRHLDFGCCVLCTTRDTSILDVSFRNKFYVHLKEGFTLEESRTFFADSLKIPVSKLSKCVDSIWIHTEGFPLVIAIISAIVRRHPNNIDGSFKTCLQKLQDNSLINVKSKSPYEYPCIRQALEMSVESLQELKDYYLDLAIFPNDFFIYGQVLAILWDSDIFEVEEIMKSFIDKSVAIQVSNGHISNSYNIHDLFLHFMKNTEGSTMVERHERLLKRYLQKYGGKYESLPNDGYILQYLGHHLHGAEMYDVFPEVFLNLKLIIAKLAATGPADLLGDFRRYKEHITQNGKYSKELKDIEEFVRSNAHLLANTHYDVLQVALFQPSTSGVFHKAKHLSREKSNGVYYEWINRDNLKNARLLCTRLQQESIFCAIFSCDGRHIISGGGDNVIKIIRSDSGHEVMRLEGHTGIITWLAHCKDHFNNHKEIVVSSSADCTVRIWHISSKALKSSKKVNKIHSPFIVFKNHKAEVSFCCILRNGKQVASIDKNGEIKIWDPYSGKETASWQAHFETNDSLSCDLSLDGTMAVSAAATFLRLWDIHKKIPIWEHQERHFQFTSCLFTPEQTEILASFSCMVGVFSVESGVRIYMLMDPNRKSLLHCTISEDGAFIAASSMMQSIMVWKRESREIIDYNHGHKGWVYSVSFSPIRKDETDCHNSLNGSALLLSSAGDDGTVIIWKTSSTSEKLETILREVYSVQFDECNEPFIAAVDMNNKIKIYDGKQQLLYTENGSVAPSFRIQCIAVSHKKDKVLYGSSCGYLKLFDIRSSTSKLLSKSDYSLCCCLFTSDDKIIIAGYHDGNILIFQKDIILPESHSAAVTCLKLFNDDKDLISCSFDNTLKVWHVATGFLKYTCTGHLGSVVSCDITSDGKLIASSSADKTVILWDAATGTSLAHLTGHQDCARICKFAPRFDILVSGDDSGILKLWRINKVALLDSTLNRSVHSDTAELLNSVSVGKGDSWIHDVDFSEDGSRFVICSEDIQWWSTSEILKNRSDLKALQSIPIRGSKATSIYCSKNFESFVCVDDTGVLYHLKLFTYENKKS